MKFESSGLGGQKSNFKFASTGLSQDSPIPGLTSSSFKIHHSSLTLGVTAAHPFWSVDREGFVPAGELRQYERVVAMDGREFRLTSITPRDGPETVYNFEVANEHVYYVGEDGLLVHNNYFRRIYYGAKNLASRIGRWFSDSRSWRTIKKGRGGTPPGMSFEHIISRNGWFAKKLKIPEQFLNGKFNSGLLLPARWNNGFLAATGWRGFRNRGLFVSVQSHRSGFLATVVGTVGTGNRGDRAHDGRRDWVTVDGLSLWLGRCSLVRQRSRGRIVRWKMAGEAHTVMQHATYFQTVI